MTSNAKKMLMKVHFIHCHFLPLLPPPQIHHMENFQQSFIYSHITELLSQDTCSWKYTPTFNKPQSSLAMLSSVTSSPSWVCFKWHPNFCNNYCHMRYTVPAFCSGMWPIQNIYHREWCIMKQLVINHTNSFLTSCLW
jgi:hypothetical protein